MIRKLQPLTTREVTRNAQRRLELEIIAKMPVEIVKASKVHDKWFDLPIPNYLRFKS